MKLLSETNYKTYKNHRQEPYFTFLKQGLKYIEGRLEKGLYAQVSKGDHIHVYSVDEKESVEVVVLGVRKYSSFLAMLQVEPFKKVLPDVDTPEEGVSKYREFYSKENEVKYGVVAIEVTLV